MPKVSVNILTKNRAQSLHAALESINRQSYADFEIIVANDGSTDVTAEFLENIAKDDPRVKIIHHVSSVGITLSRREALEQSRGEYVAILDDDDEWIDNDKLKKQVEFLDSHPGYVLVGGGITVNSKLHSPAGGSNAKFRPSSDKQIRKTMLLRNNFFTSTVMFRRQTALQAGGFIAAGADLAEDYDLWLRLGQLGKMYNPQEVFTAYCLPSYNKERFRQFLQKQLRLISQYRQQYPYYWPANLILRFRLFLNS